MEKSYSIYSDDFNAPNEELCLKFLDKAVSSGINLIDTAEQYPIPSSSKNPEGKTESLIGRWLTTNPNKRKDIVIATKITGGRNVNKENIMRDCEGVLLYLLLLSFALYPYHLGSLRRLKTDYIDVYQLHWPARYSPQGNLSTIIMMVMNIRIWRHPLLQNDALPHVTVEPYYASNAGFEEIALAMGNLISAGKIRGWGLCNDNAYGLTACCYVAKQLGVPPPVSMQNDYSLIDR